MPLAVIISGAGIGGLALSHWLHLLGARVIVVERTPRFEPLGHYITLKGNGVEMVRRMGIADVCQARAAPREETCFYTASGRRLRCERTAQLGRMLGGYILFRRADLQAALYELVRDHIDLRLGTQISAAQITENRVEVQSDGRTEKADILVGADGVHSNVRRLVFGEGFERPLGGHYVALTPRLRHGLSTATRSYLGTGQMVNLLPVAEDAITAVVYQFPPRSFVSFTP